MKKEITFDSEMWYSTSQIVELSRAGFFPYKSISTIYELIRSGKLPVVIKGDENKRTYSVQGKDLAAFAESQKIVLEKKNDK